MKRFTISKRIISENDQQRIGNAALKILKTEYDEFKKGITEECNNCVVKVQYGMVCRHQMKDNQGREPVFTLEDINGIYLLKNRMVLSIGIETSSLIRSKKNSYSYYISRLSDIVSSSQSDKKLQLELDEFLEKCESRKKEEGNSGIKVYKTPGVKMKSRRKVDMSLGITKMNSKQTTKSSK